MAIELLTYDDCVQHLVDVFQFTDVTRLGRLARIAIDSVYRDLPYRFDWKYYERRATLTTNAQYTTGTAAYDHTGGAYERLVTLSGTVPTWAAQGYLILNDVHYRIAEYKSTTTFTLFEEDNPGADVAATTFTIYRKDYPTPLNFRKSRTLVDTEDEREIPMLGVATAHVMALGVDSDPSTPRFCRLHNPGDFYSVWSMEFLPPPDAARTYDISYQAKPRDILTVSYATGTVSTSSTTVTGSTTTFPSNCVGSIIRFGTSASSTAVTNKFGSNPFTEQRTIVARNSATELIVDVAPTSAYSTGTAYQISDPIDVSPGMQSAFRRAIEAEMAKLGNLKDYVERQAIADQALMYALENEPSDTYSLAGASLDPYPTWENES